MAATKITIQLEAVAGFVEKLGAIIEIDEDIDAVVEKYISELRLKADANEPVSDGDKKEKKVRKSRKNPDGTIKPKRKPSAYNMFVSEHWAMLTEKGFKGQELIRQAAILWNNRDKTTTAVVASDTEAEPETDIEADNE